MNPGNSGASKTRAMVCELLAIKLLKEFSTRELVENYCFVSPEIVVANPVVDWYTPPAIYAKFVLSMTDWVPTSDALSYDFYPLQGLAPSTPGNVTPGPNWNAPQSSKTQPRAARISTLEIAIRAQAKRFLAHPLVVQQLEAIWAGSIVFHSAADNLHRPPEKVVPNQNRGYGATGNRGPILQASPDRLQPAKQRDHLNPVSVATRRSATLYDPQDASLFKLSRLRVPRYRQFLSTCSFAILLGLYLAVLIERSLTITALEVVFWVWSAGFMLDEIVGFNEQGFSLYIMSFWNAFDVGILLLLGCYYGMRLYGVLMPEARKHQTADRAYDLLAANAVLLFPRLFSVLDHYRYFSQLLIAFRMMALDMAAVFILIVISCSGFFVAFTLSFGGDGYDANGVAYQLFQILLGFTPAAWESWEHYNVLGKAMMTLFLFICHFLIVTILITVLTNSFMAIVQNANEEHQFVFAVNTISMVKSDALFSYVAPTNVVAWLLTPLRFLLPFRQYVRLNRTVIKVTHFHILFTIYAYERLLLSHSTFESTDLITRGRPVTQTKAFDNPGTALNLFSPRQHRLREPSVATHQKDRALDEVFRRPFRDNTMRHTQKSHERRKTSNVVKNWMQGMGPNGTANSPDEQDKSVVEQLEARKLAHQQSLLAIRRRPAGRSRDFTQATMSIASDPEEFGTNELPEHALRTRENSDLLNRSMDGMPQHTDADGDDELITSDEDENVLSDPPIFTPNVGNTKSRSIEGKGDDYFQRTPTSRTGLSQMPASWSSSRPQFPTLSQPVQPRGYAYRPNRGAHARNVSNTTVLYDPPAPINDSSSSPSRKAITARNSARNTGSGAQTPVTAGRRTPKRQLTGAARPRPIMPPRNLFQSAPDLAGMLMLDTRRERRSSLKMDLGSDLGDNKAVGGGFVGAVPSSFATQMAFATGAMSAKQQAAGHSEDQRRMGKLMLARMNALEEGFRDILKEVKDWRKDDARSTGDDRPELKFSKSTSRKSRKEEKAKNKSPADQGDRRPKTDEKAEGKAVDPNEQ